MEWEDDAIGDELAIVDVTSAFDCGVGDVDDDRLVQRTTPRSVSTIMQTIIDSHLIVTHPLRIIFN